MFASVWGASAFAQDLEGTWLRLTVKGKGIIVDNADDSVRKNGVFRAKSYMLVEYPAGANVYTGDTACEIATRVSHFVGGYTVVGVKVLEKNVPDGAAAGVHALDMATNNFFEHAGSDGPSPFDRIAAAGFTGSPQGENVAAGLHHTVAGWMGSTGHCNNIMGSSYTCMGAAYAFEAT